MAQKSHPELEYNYEDSPCNVFSNYVSMGGDHHAATPTHTNVVEVTLNGKLLADPQSGHLPLYGVDVEVVEIFPMDTEPEQGDDPIETWVHITQPEH